MKIAFTGAQSTGKTTLLEALKANQSYKYDYEFVDEITRRMVKKGLKINEEGSDTTQLLIMNEHIKNNIIVSICIYMNIWLQKKLYWIY